MSVAVAVAREAPSPTPGREVELLRGALDQDLLAELGWDPKAMVVRAVLGHPSFGFVVCEVPGCELPATYSGNICTTCQQRFITAVAAGRSNGDLEEFKQIPRTPPGRPPEQLCAVCCVPPDCVRPARANGLCNAHEARRKYHGLTVEEFLAGDDLQPYPAFGRCRREGASAGRTTASSCAGNARRCGSIAAARS